MKNARQISFSSDCFDCASNLYFQMIRLLLICLETQGSMVSKQKVKQKYIWHDEFIDERETMLFLFLQNSSL